MNNIIQEWQKYLKERNLYQGPIDGIENNDLIKAIYLYDPNIKTPITLLPPKEDPHIKSWKEYAKSKGLYNGDVNSPIIDDEFKNTLILLEQKLSKEVPSIDGLIYIKSKNSINQDINVIDYEEALKLLEEHKNLTPKKASFKSRYAQDATLDAIGKPWEEDPPLAVKWHQTQEESKINSGDPDTSQQQGRLAENIPNNKYKGKEETVPQNLDDRITKIINMKK